MTAREVIEGLNPHDVARLAEVLLPSVRLDLRNAAIRDALARFYCGVARTPAAGAMARDLAQGACAGTVKGDRLGMILALNRGRKLSARQIIDIAAGSASKMQEFDIVAFRLHRTGRRSQG